MKKYNNNNAIIKPAKFFIQSLSKDKITQYNDTTSIFIIISS